MDGFASVSVNNVSNTFIIDSNLDEAGSSLVGSYMFIWVQGNKIEHRKIIGYNLEESKVLFETTSSPPYEDEDTRYSIVNNPSSLVLEKQGEYYINESDESDGRNKIYLWPYDDSNPSESNIEISNIQLGVGLQGNYLTLEGFKITKYSGGHPVSSEKSGGYNGLIIQNNEISNFKGNAGNGIYFFQPKDSIFRNNYIHDFSEARGVAFTQGARNWSVINNTFDKIIATVIYFAGCSNSSIIDNTIQNSGGGGAHGNSITLYSSNNDLVANNYLINSTPATLSDNTDILLYNNIFGGGLFGWGQTHNTSIFNNIIIEPKNSYYIIGEHNIFINNIAPGLGGAEIYSNNIINNSANLIELFQDLQNQDYHLKQGSPAIDAGADISDIISELRLKWPEYDFYKDIEGNPRPSGSSWDIGPYEYQSGQTCQLTSAYWDIT
jgi:hypothetical protein